MRVGDEVEIIDTNDTYFNSLVSVGDIAEIIDKTTILGSFKILFLTGDLQGGTQHSSKKKASVVEKKGRLC